MPWQRPLDRRSWLCLHWIAWSRKHTHRIKHHVASYHTTKVTAHKASSPFFVFSLFITLFCLVPCGRLSWLLVSFWGHVNIVHHIVSYRIIANCIPKLVAMATSLNTSGPPTNTLFLRHIRAHNPNSSTNLRRVSLYFTTRPPFAPQNCFFPWGIWTPHLKHGSLGPPESSAQTASRSVQPFLQGSLVWQSDSQTMQLGR